MIGKVLLGKHIYDTQDRFLYLDNSIVSIEPKFIEVLDYLLNNHDRYITVQELHDNVWANRIVSDATVRRVISRLRSILEADTSNPSIIKSISKRGYRIYFSADKHSSSVIDTSPLTTQMSQTTNNTEGNPPLTPSNTQEQEQEQEQEQKIAEIKEVTPKKHDKKRSYLRLLTISIFMLVLMLSLKHSNGVYNIIKDNLYSQAQNHEISHTANSSINGSDQVLTEISEIQLPMNAYLLALSNDKKLIFYQILNPDNQYDTYLKDLESGRAISIEKHSARIDYAAFTPTNQAILLSKNSLSAKGTLEVWNIDDDLHLQNKQVLLDNIKGATAIVAISDNTALAALIDETEAVKSLFYKLGWNGSGIVNQQQITFNQNHYNIDYLGSLSHNRNLLAYIRIHELDYQQEIHVLDLVSKKIILRMPNSRSPKALTWLDDDNLLFLTDSELMKINIHSQKKDILLANNHNKYRKVFSNQENIYLYIQKPLNKYYIELDLSKAARSQTLVDRNLESVSLNYRAYQTQDYYEVIKVNGSYSLTQWHKNKHTDASILLQSLDKISLLPQSSTGQLLIKLGERLTLFDLNSHEMNFISSEQENTGGAVFSNNGIDVLYAKKHNGAWAIFEYTVSSKTSRLLLKGYRDIKKAGTGYVVASADGRLFTLDSLESKPLALNVSLFMDFEPSWYVDLPYLYWLDRENGQLKVLDITTDLIESIDLGHRISGYQFSYKPQQKKFLFKGFSNFKSTLKQYSNIISSAAID
ncbi:winged helix-turn-helix domain-containing protein [uncultured Shewanella sp.]|uniref:winged helix-turn-helix domain-containing protein n=1 Tax=uncultured Shewanella sp. TaxID=173975 RepID=UPI002639C6D4|nr:winged helix-turn-helix domain-containing protein [uncultured Shewanella sp.]